MQAGDKAAGARGMLFNPLIRRLEQPADHCIQNRKNPNLYSLNNGCRSRHPLLTFYSIHKNGIIRVIPFSENICYVVGSYYGKTISDVQSLKMDSA